ncbi:MAG: hypothetical protein ACYDBV_14455 [Nitrospiria bacterium]
MRGIIHQSFMLFLAGLFILSGCASKTSLTNSSQFDPGYLKDISEIPAIYHPPSNSFLVNDSSLAGILFGAFGGRGGSAITLTSAKTNGESLSKKIGLEDPIINVQKDFLAQSDGLSGIHHFRPVDEPVIEDSIEDLRKVYKKGMVLDFKTTGWGLAATSSSQYKVYYNAQSRLINLTDHKINRVGDCHFEGKESTLDSLQQENGVLLKSILNEAARQCSLQLMTAILEKRLDRSTPETRIK